MNPFPTATAISPALSVQCRACGKVWAVEDLAFFKERPLLIGDCYWRLLCASCNNNNNTHRLERDPITWPVILHLILYNLHIQRPDKKYFKMKEEICPSIIRYWDDLMPHKNKISNWENTVSSALSTHQDVFLSGIAELGQLGWWALRKKEPPYSLNNYQRSRPAPLAMSTQASSKSLSSKTTTGTRLVPILKKKETKISLLHDSLAKMSPEQLEAFVSKLSKARQQSHPMNLQEEMELLQKLVSIPSDKCTSSLCRMKAKLSHRCASAGKMPHFNLDSTLLAYMKAPLDGNIFSAIVPYKFHPFFTMNLEDLPFVANPSLLFCSKLSASPKRAAFMHAGRLIKRDWDSIPPKLGVIRFFSSELHPLDFVNLHSTLIQPVNRLLCQFFWPGIEVAEFLSFPQFSIIATYKKLVVGCAFMAPESNYITFLLVHPDWERANIASYMLWYLIEQSGPDKDVTLHASASNPALILYQKFGFKPEQFIVKFYDKYYDYSPRTEQSRNAFFLRLKKF
jgi:hypothetical protein